MRSCLTLCILLLLAGIAGGQIYPARHFDVDNGLPSSEVYRVHQDERGYIWMATDNGLVRYDGYEMKVFGTADGLPDNRVYHFTTLSDGRTIAYTLNRRSVELRGDSIIPLNPDPFKFKQTDDPVTLTYVRAAHLGSKGDLFFFGGRHLLSQESSDSNTPFSIKSFSDFQNSIVRYSDHGQPVMVGAILSDSPLKHNYYFDKIVDYELSSGDTNIQPIEPIDSHGADFGYQYYDTVENIGIFSFWKQVLMVQGDNVTQTEFEHRVIMTKLDRRRWLWVTMSGGGAIAYPNYPDLSKSIQVLPEFSVADVLMDEAGGYWFSTLSKGVYYMAPGALDVTYFKDAQTAEVTDLCLSNNHELLATYFTGDVQLMSDNLTPIYEENTGNFLSKATYHAGLDQYIISGIKPDVNYDQLSGSLMNLTDHIALQSSLGHLVHGDTLYTLGTYLQSFTFDPEQRLIARYELPLRPGNPKNGIMLSNGDLLLSRETGLMLKKSDPRDSVVRGILENAPELAQGIDEMLLVRDTIYLASFQKGLFATTEALDRVWKIPGLEGYRIKSMVRGSGNEIFVGSYQGLTRLKVKDGSYELRHVGVNEGLFQGRVTALEYRNDTLWAGGNGKLARLPASLFDRPNPKPRLLLDSVNINGSFYPIDKIGAFDADENNLTFTFRGLHYGHSSNPEYRYRLIGLDSTWISTSERSVRYSSLRPGTYTFQLQSRASRHDWGQTLIHFDFVIAKPFWQQWWVIALLAVLFGSLAWTGINWRVKRLKAQARIQRNMLELKAEALQSQVNPHFIFNSLNSIQSFLSENDQRSAEIYLARFGKLIRRILEHSRQKTVTITNEVSLLENYLEMEKLRFKERFDYTLEVEAELEADELHLPPMLLQPLIENAILHGILPKKGNGSVSIKFFSSDDDLICRIEDDGLGRERAAALRPERYHPSRGLEITKERISIFAAAFGGRGDIQIHDQHDEQGIPSGTLVEIKLPLLYNEHLASDNH